MLTKGAKLPWTLLSSLKGTAHIDSLLQLWSLPEQVSQQQQGHHLPSHIPRATSLQAVMAVMCTWGLQTSL